MTCKTSLYNNISSVILKFRLNTNLVSQLTKHAPSRKNSMLLFDGPTIRNDVTIFHYQPHTQLNWFKQTVGFNYLGWNRIKNYWREEYE